MRSSCAQEKLYRKKEIKSDSCSIQFSHYQTAGEKTLQHMEKPDCNINSRYSPIAVERE